MAKVLIVGAGAAGLMAAGAAVRQGHQVTVLEHMDKPGQKILVTGKGRCNVTNDCPAEEFLRHVRTNPRCIRRWGLSRPQRLWNCSRALAWS